jgi:uncharacterized protein YvpB
MATLMLKTTGLKIFCGLLLLCAAACGAARVGVLAENHPATLAPPRVIILHLSPEPKIQPSASPTSLVTLTAAPLPSPTPAGTPTPSLPAEHFIRGITGHKQYFPIGCEAGVAKDWANFYGYDFSEFEFQFKLPISDNPDYGFVGSVNAPWGQVPPYGYGVYAGPVAEVLNSYGVPAKAYKSYTLEQLKGRIALDKPVIAWVIGNVVGGFPSEFTDSKGRKTIVAAYEHVVIVTGYDPTHIRYLNNGRFFQAPLAVFLNSWGILGNMVVADR